MTVHQQSDWQVIAEQTNDRAWPLLSWLMRVFLSYPEAPEHSTATWTVRRIRTGEVQKITAYSEEEFAARLAAGAFD